MVFWYWENLTVSITVIFIITLLPNSTSETVSYSLRHWEFLQLHGFLGLLVVIEWGAMAGPVEVGSWEKGPTSSSWDMGTLMDKKGGRARLPVGHIQIHVHWTIMYWWVYWRVCWDVLCTYWAVLCMCWAELCMYWAVLCVYQTVKAGKRALSKCHDSISSLHVLSLPLVAWQTNLWCTK